MIKKPFSTYLIQFLPFFSSIFSASACIIKDRAVTRAEDEYQKAVTTYKVSKPSDAAYYLGAMAYYIGVVSQYSYSYRGECIILITRAV